jgi:multiple sugar transport system substrate-binding protein
MNASKKQLIIFGVFAAIVLILLLIVLGIIPLGGKKGNPNSKKSSSLPFEQQSVPRQKLTVWVYEEKENDLENFISKFNNANNADVSLRSFNGVDYNTYLTSLLQAMAEGRGPDVFVIPSTEIPLFLNKITPLPLNVLPLIKLKNSFPQVVVNDVVFKDGIYGLPLSLDTLALIYNQDLFAKAGVVFPPQDWHTFVDILKKVTIKNEEGKIIQGGAALGATNVKNAPDILYSILLQLGSTITKGGRGDIKNEKGIAAFKFFMQFSDKNSEYFTWDKTMPDSREAFAQNKVAMIFDYQSALQELKQKNSYLNLEIAPFPQLVTSTSAYYAVSARYFVFSVSKQTKNPSLAWNFVTSLTLDQSNAEDYVKNSKKPPALLTLIDKYKDDPKLSVFAKQSLYAKSWYGPNRELINKNFVQTIDLLYNVSQEKEKGEIISQLENKITTIINNIY